MKLRLEPTLGLRLAGSGSARPSEVGLGADGPRALDNCDVWQLLFGPKWQSELERRGWQAEHPWDAWGVRSREWVHLPGESRHVDRACEQLALRAARKALGQAGLDAAQLDLVVATTSTPDRISASLAGRLTARLGTDAAALDVRAGGAGGLQAWSTAASMLAAGANTALVVASEVTSGYLTAADPGSAALFGDGASAQVLQRAAGSSQGMLGASIVSDASRARSFTVPGALPPSEDALERELYRFRTPDSAYVACMRAHWEEVGADLAQLARPAQAHVLLGVASRAQAEATGLQGDVHTSLETHGATGAAAAGIALDELLRSNSLAHDTLLLGAVGGGIHRAALAWRLGPPAIATTVVDS